MKRKPEPWLFFPGKISNLADCLWTDLRERRLRLSLTVLAFGKTGRGAGANRANPDGSAPE
jgi:hypothetical protein